MNSDHRPIESSVTTSDALSAVQSIRRQLFRDFTRAHLNRPRASSTPDTHSRRDSGAPTYIEFGSSTTCDISSAILATNIVYVPPPEPEEDDL